MKTKVVFMLVMLCLVVLALVMTPSEVIASCSGDDCGCHIAEAACEASCPPPLDPNGRQCVLKCIHQEVKCGIACCDPY